MKDVICIVCPKGCEMRVDAQSGEVSGAGCKRGISYGLNEVKNPLRTLTTTIRIEGGVHSVLPVRTDEALPKKHMFDAMKLANCACVRAPVKMGDVVVRDLLGTGVNFIAERDMGRRPV